MTYLNLHLLLNYYPAIFAALATIILAAGLYFGKPGAYRAALKLLVFVFLLTLIVVFLGEFAGMYAARARPAGAALEAQVDRDGGIRNGRRHRYCRPRREHSA